MAQSQQHASSRKLQFGVSAGGAGSHLLLLQPLNLANLPPGGCQQSGHLILKMPEAGPCLFQIDLSPFHPVPGDTQLLVVL